MKSRKVGWWVLIAVLGGIQLGCASTVGPGEVASKWSCKLREMQITPVFPPREDLHVGDVYWLPNAKPGSTTPADAYCNRTPADGFLEVGTHVAYFEQVNEALKSYYKSRPSLPRTGTSTISISSSGSSAFTISSSPRSTSPDSATDTIFAGAADRTRLVAFPDFMTIQVKSFDLGAILPIAGVLAPLGISSSSADSAAISIPVAESYGLPYMRAEAALGQAQIDELCRWNKNADSDKSGDLYFVLEVFYARAIDVNIRAKDGFAFSVARDRDGAGTTTVPTLPGGSVTVTVSELTGEAQANGLANGAARRVADMVALRNSVPGVSLGYQQGNASEIGLRRLFDRPVAIGVRTARLKPRQIDNKCSLGIEVSGGPPPTVMGGDASDQRKQSK